MNNNNNNSKFNAPQTITLPYTRVKGLIKGKLARKALTLAMKNRKFK